MKKMLLLCALAAAALGAHAQAAGSEAQPLTVTEILEQGTPETAVPDTYVQGYIVGYYGKVFGIYQYQTDVPASKTTNVFIAATADEKSTDKWFLVQLPKGEVRDALSPYVIGNYGKKVVVRGSHEAYVLSDSEKESRFNGLKNTDWYKFVEETVEPGPGGGDDDDAISIFSSLGEDEWTMDPYWTEDVVTMPSSMSYVWRWKSVNGKNFMNASGYVNDIDNATKSYLVAKNTFNLTGYKTVTAEFEHAAKFQTTLRSLCGFVVRESGAEEWDMLPIPVWPEAGTWNFVSSGKIDLSAYIGKNIQVGFLYQSTSEGADTWEVRNIEIKGTTDGSELKPAALAWSATEAVAIVGEDFDAPTLTFATTAPIYYESSNPSVASINASGAVTAFAAGETTIRAYSAANGEYEAGEASYKLTVELPENMPEVFNLLLDSEATSCDWTFENETLGEGLSYVWSWKEYNDAHYLNGNAYVGGPVEAVAYAISPVISLAGYKEVTVSFEHAAKFQTNLAMLSSFLIREEGATEWEKLRIKNWPEPGNWFFVNSGKADISAYDGKRVQLAFQYGSNQYGADTWEIRNVRLSGVVDQSGINDIENIDADTAPVYYDLSGRRVSGTPAAGIYIRVAGAKATKVLVK